MKRVGAKPSGQTKPHTGRRKEDKKFYRSSAWTTLSKLHRTDNPFCVECAKLDILTDCSPGKRTGVTDHITPIAKGGSKWDSANLQTLCNKHHNAKSAKDK